MTEKNTFSISSAASANSYKILIILSMFYMSIMLCNAILTNRYVGTDVFFILGGTLTSPFLFVLDGIIAEIYGYKITRTLILVGFLAQTFFVSVCLVITVAPAPSFFSSETKQIYSLLLGPSLSWINISGFFAYFIANLSNSYMITRWKILLKGRYFWLRSTGSSIFAEALYSFIAILMMEFQRISLNNVFKIVLISFLIKVSYSLIFAGPATLIIQYIKRKTGLDTYDLPTKFKPSQSILHESQ